MQLILASQSPRRYVLLSALGYPIIVAVPNIDEARRSDESPADMVQRLAQEKAAKIAVQYSNDIVIAADTTVVLGDELLEKPTSREHAKSMLRMLSGTKHNVLTGCVVRLRDNVLSRVESTTVWFHPMSEQQIDAYVESKEPMDKAGAYAIQGAGAGFIAKFEGSLSNVIGLPMEAVRDMLERIQHGK